MTTKNIWRYGTVFMMAAFASTAALALSPTALTHDDMQFFENRIRPLLADKCYKCHSRDADKVKGGFMLDTHEALLHGGNSGAAIVPGNPDESLLIKAVRYTDEDLRMPPKGEKLSDQEIADLTEWVQRGAPDPRSLAAKGSAASYGGVGRNHWSFQPVKKQAVPVVNNAAWCQSPVDNFILAKLEASDLVPNSPADKRTLIRRVTFDLIGLPPSESEIQAFLADASPDAFAKVVDRLLASPQYGEHWARYWLDVARYADTKGETRRRNDQRYPHAWTYRDYVIDAFNRDKPYNQFIVEQLAADRLLAKSTKKSKDAAKPFDQASLAALGFLTVGNRFNDNVHDIVNDRIDVTTKAFLGLTVSCARCHDHKFDPIPQKDYYSLYGVFANTYEPKTSSLPLVHPVPKTTELDDYLVKVQALDKQKEQLTADYVAFRKTKTRDPQQRKELVRREGDLDREAGDLETTHPGAPARAQVLLDVPRSKDYPVLIRGEAQNLGEIVPRRFLEALSPNPKQRPEFTNGSGRLDLANAIADPSNPLTARVLVNRIWQQHFGSGFVPTPDDLGNMSAPPTHPELLDYLAGRFVEEGWSIKKLQREILLTSTYQESSAPNPAYAETDPDSKLLWRHNLRPLNFEELHDALLAIAGTLDLNIVGGKSVPIGNEGFVTRRAVYTYIDRFNPAEILTQFDFPNPSVPTGRRYETIVPQQSLFLMNSPMVIETARKLVERPEFQQLPGDDERVASLYLAVFQRPPTKQEITLCLRYVKATPANNATPRAADTSTAMEQNRKRAKAGPKGRYAPQPEPGAAAFTSREPVDPWTKLAHALFQTNEAVFYN